MMTARLAGHGDGAHHALFHAAGHLVGEVVQAPFRSGHVDRAQGSDGAVQHRPFVFLVGDAQRFAQLVTDREHRLSEV